MRMGGSHGGWNQNSPTLTSNLTSFQFQLILNPGFSTRFVRGKNAPRSSGRGAPTADGEERRRRSRTCHRGRMRGSGGAAWPGANSGVGVARVRLDGLRQAAGAG